MPDFFKTLNSVDIYMIIHNWENFLLTIGYIPDELSLIKKNYQHYY